MSMKALLGGVMAGAGVAWYLYKRSRAHTVQLDPVHPFDPEKYLGKWYEIARLNHCFERNLNNTTAHYSLNPNGTIRVVNRGYNYLTHEHKESTAVARFTGPQDIGALEVSFTPPFFYSAYLILALDKNYKYALVAGKDRDSLWILSRETTIPEKVLNEFLEIAVSHDYDVEKLIKVEHDHIADTSKDSLITKTVNKMFS